MKYLSNSFDQINIDEKLCLTIGNFDGIHKGHREIIKNLIQQTKTSNLKSAILSFTPHPKIYFNKQKNFMINSQSKKNEILEDLGLDYLIDLHFNDKLTQLSHVEFEDKILLEKLNSKRILIGKDFQYGNQRKGNIETLKEFCEKMIQEKKALLLSDYVALETKKLFVAAQIAHEGAIDIINNYLIKFSFPSEESKKLTRVALLNYCGAAILMPYKLFHKECMKNKYDIDGL